MSHLTTKVLSDNHVPHASLVGIQIALDMLRNVLFHGIEDERLLLRICDRNYRFRKLLNVRLKIFGHFHRFVHHAHGRQLVARKHGSMKEIAKQR